ncbi:MAG: hypothetical protein WBV39_16010 [Rudaea sp.]
MNEMRVDPSSVEPPPSPDEGQPPNSGKGSMAMGFGLAWLIVVVGHVLLFAAGTIAALFLPELVVIVVGVVYAAQGKTRAAGGVFIGLATVFAVALLLVAACFGLMSGADFR